MSDQEIIISSLKRVERRIRTNRLLGELGMGAAAFLALPVILKIWDLLSPIPGRTLTALAGIWLVVLAAYIIWRVREHGTLGNVAAMVDRSAKLQDELKTAFWFINNPRPSEWVDVQIRRAARTAQNIDMERLYPRQIPHTSYIAAAMALAFIVLNFIPLPLNHNWLALQAAPAFSLTPEEAAILKETEALLKKAEKLNQSELVEKLEEIVQQLQEGAIDAGQAAQMLEAIQNDLDEGNLDVASINEGLEEIAQDLEQTSETEAAGTALRDKQLREAAEEMRKLAEQLKQNPESADDVGKTLEQAAENQRAGLEELAKQLKEAAGNLKKQNQQGAEQSLDKVAQELENIQEKIQSQELKNMAAQQKEPADAGEESRPASRRHAAAGSAGRTG